MTLYHYTECGLDNIYLINGFEITKNKDDEEIFIHDIHGLHKEIGMILVNKPGLLIGNEIKYIRTTLDFSQTTLANLLGCTYQTIFLWEKGKQPISKIADRVLRKLLLEHLNPEENKTMFTLINEIANLEAKVVPEKSKIKFKEVSNEWKIVA